MKLNLDGAVALVTGGSKGIGRAVVESLLEEGAIVAYCSRNATGTEFSDPKAFGSKIDITDKESMTNWIADVAKERGGIDIVVSNVSALAIPNTPENWLATYQTDLEAVVNLVNATLPHLLKSSRSPNIITISSFSGREIDFTSPGPYGTFKAALIHYSQSLAKSLAPQGVRVNCVSPGNVFIEDGIWGGIQRDNPELFAKAMLLNPMGRMATAKEIVDSVVFLASPLSGFTSGTNLAIDGALSNGIHL